MGDAQIGQFTKEEIALLKKKDNTAFKKLFMEMFHHIRYFCEKMVKDKFEAEDIATLSFIKYLERADKFDSFNEIKAFLYLASRNACLDYLEKEKVKQNYTLQAGNLASEAITQEVRRFEYEAIMFEKLFAEVVREIDNLPEQRRKVFKMVVFEKMDAEEVARQLNITPGTVRTHCSNAMKKLKMIFGEKELLVIVVLFFGNVPELQNYLCHPA
jgi:RNA polymerase sigma-19 factor, ECF subfamily